VYTPNPGNLDSNINPLLIINSYYIQFLEISVIIVVKNPVRSGRENLAAWKNLETL
jgi:hypothetical protein